MARACRRGKIEHHAVPQSTSLLRFAARRPAVCRVSPPGELLTLATSGSTLVGHTSIQEVPPCFARAETGASVGRDSELAGGGCFGRVGGLAVFADDADEGLGSARETAVAAVEEAGPAPEGHPFDREGIHFPRLH